MQDSVTFVCCIEYGRLEAQTLLMLRSLRRFGGRLATAPVIAVVGRRGAPLGAATVSELKALDVSLVQASKSDNRHPWFNYANKIAAVLTAQRLAATPVLAWLDSDILVAREPSGLLLGADEDFAARCEFLPPAVYYGRSENVAYWRELCRMLGASYADLPWVDVKEGFGLQKAYFNSGAFSWRRSTGFAAAYAEAFDVLLRSRLAQPGGEFFTADQVILSPVVAALGLNWRHLEARDHLMIFPGLIDGAHRVPHMEGASLIHYSGSLGPAHRERFLARLGAELPALAVWFEEQERQYSPALSPMRKLIASGYRAARHLRLLGYRRRLRPCADAPAAEGAGTLRRAPEGSKTSL